MRFYLPALVGVAVLAGCAAADEDRLAAGPAPSSSGATAAESSVDSSDAFPPACVEPAGGWTAADASRADDSALQEAIDATRAHPDHSGLWVTHLRTPSPDTAASEGIVLNVAVAGDVEVARTELAAIWGGPLCVVAAPRTLAQLTDIRDELFAGAAVELGLEPVIGAADEVGNAVRLGIRGTLTAEQRAALDARYGAGTVVVEERSQVQLVPGAVTSPSR
jgi:hypothetical protein